MSKLKIATIGGSISTAHLPHLARRDDVELVGLADLNPAAQQTADKFGIERFVADYRELLPLCDAVLICVPTFLHADIACEAFALCQRFEFFFTPQCASWLNRIEIEFSALSRQCLNRRIPTQQQLEREVLALVQERERQGIKINWQFSIECARDKFQTRYEEAQLHKTT